MVHFPAKEKRAPKASDLANLLDSVSCVMEEQRKAYDTRRISLRTDKDRRELDTVMKRLSCEPVHRYIAQYSHERSRLTPKERLISHDTLSLRDSTRVLEHCGSFEPGDGRVSVVSTPSSYCAACDIAR
jgi:hypothetical protein